MILQKDDLKAIVDMISPLIDARAKTTEIVLKAEINAQITDSTENIKIELRSEIREVKNELRKEIKEVKKDLLEEVLAARAEAKIDSVTMQGKIDKVIKNHERRISALEETSGISHKN